MTAQEQELFVYDCVPNIDGYDPKLMLGLTFAELSSAGLGLVTPVLLTQSLVGLMLGMLCALTLLLMLKRFERFGNVPLPLYLYKRIRAAQSTDTLSLPQLVPTINATITVHTYAGEHIATLN